MLRGDRQADNRDREEQREYQVHDGKFEPGQNDPDDIHDDRDRAARRLGIDDLAPEWREHATRQPKAHESEWNANDRDAKQQSAEHVAQEDQESAEDEKNEIAKQ